MRRAAIWLFPLIAFGVALFIAIFLVQINPSAPALSSSQSTDEPQSDEGLTGKWESWLTHFSDPLERGYFYPVNEVTLKLDPDEEGSLLQLYRVSVNVTTPEELLQVKEELSLAALPFDMHNRDDLKIVTVDSTDQAQLLSLVTKLKTYQITATLSPYTEEN
jgi:hypothetical protein